MNITHFNLNPSEIKNLHFELVPMESIDVPHRTDHNICIRINREDIE